MGGDPQRFRAGDRRREPGQMATARAARTGRNPQTGKEIKIAAKKVVKFKAGAELSASVA